MKTLTQLLSFPLSGICKRSNTQLVQKVPQFGKNTSMIKIKYLPKNVGKFVKCCHIQKIKMFQFVDVLCDYRLQKRK